MPVHPLPIQDLTDYVLPRLAAWNVPGAAVAVVHGGETVLAQGFGLRDLEAKAPVAADTRFAIASNTKAFVATALGLLVQEGVLGWDDRVHKYLPDFALYDPYVSAELRVRDLLCHRSGLASYAGDMLQGSTVPAAEILQRMRLLPQGFGFRAGFGYCNLLYLAAAEVLTVVSGEPWERFIRRRLIEPLGMTQTVLSARDLPAHGNIATPYEDVAGTLVPVPYHQEDNLGPPGGICSTVIDLARWLRFQLAGGAVEGRALVDPAVLAETRTPHTPIRPDPSEWDRYPGSHFVAYGLGWGLMDYHGRLLVRHTGGLDGMRSVTGFLPEESLGVAVLTNQNPNSFFLALFYHLLDTALGLPGRDHDAILRQRDAEQAAASRETRRNLESSRPTAPSASLPPSALAGAYAHPYLGQVMIHESSGEWLLTFAVHPHKPGRLEPWDRDTVLCRWSDPGWQESLIPVEREERGAVSGFRVKVREDWIDSLEYLFRPSSEVPGTSELGQA